MEPSKYTTEESMAALAMTVEEIEAMENEPDREMPPPIGKYGRLFGNFLRENHPGRYDSLMLSMTLRDVCAEVDREAMEMMWTLQEQLRAKTPRPTGDFMASVRYNTMIRDQAEEIVLKEIVYRRR
jgi:hypothetical protein